MFTDAITSIEDRDRREFGRQLRATDLGMANDNGIGVAAKGTDRVWQSLALQNRRGVNIHVHDLSSAALHSRVERRRRPGGRLVEERGEHLALQDIQRPVPLDLELHLVREREEVVDVSVAELLHREDVTAVEGGVREEMAEDLHVRRRAVYGYNGGGGDRARLRPRVRLRGDIRRGSATQDSLNVRLATRDRRPSLRRGMADGST